MRWFEQELKFLCDSGDVVVFSHLTISKVQIVTKPNLNRPLEFFEGSLLFRTVSIEVVRTGVSFYVTQVI